MNGNQTANKNHVEHSFFLSEILGARIVRAGKKVGKLSDFVVKENHTLPVVTHLYISRPFGESAVIPWARVTSIVDRQIVIDVDRLADYEGVPADDALLLKDYVLDKKVLDMEGREVEVVYDVRLVLRNHTLYVSDVDLSRYGLLRRIGLKGLADFIYGLADSIKEQTISWAYIEPLPTQISGFKGDVKLKVLKEKLSDMHPVDVADILEDLDPEQRVVLFDGLDADQASDALEEIDPDVQRELVPSLKKEKVAQLIDEMTPGQAADILSVLPASEANSILPLLSAENANKVKSILEKQEENILNYATREYLTFTPDRTVEQVQDEYRLAARGKDVIMYLYVVDERRKLLGIIDIKELLLAPDQVRLKDIMVDNIISLEPDSTLKEAAAMFARYDFRALPITDDNDVILGVVPYRDVMKLTHRFWE